MLKWLRDNKLIDHGTDFHPDYVLLSVYEEDCENIQLPTADWVDIFEEMQLKFPHAKVGFGETGAQCNYRTHREPRSDKPCVRLQKKNVRKHYDELHLKITSLIKAGHRQVDYIGGYFYWYFQQDMISPNSPALAELISSIKKWDQ